MKALIVNLVHTFVGSRTPAILNNLGLETAVLTIPDSVFLKSARLSRRFVVDLEKGLPVSELARIACQAVDKWQPDLVLPQDSAAYRVLFYMLDQYRESMAQAPDCVPRINKSMGSSGYQGLKQMRRQLGLAAIELGIPILPHITPASVDEAVAFSEQEGWPVVIKNELTEDGDSITFCDDVNAVVQKFSARKNQDTLIQKYIDGPVIRHSLTSLNGTVLAEVTGEQIHTRIDNPCKAPTVVRLASIPDVSEISARLVRLWNLSGYHGFDFLYETNQDAYYVIDHNPRVNSLTNLGELAGCDLTEHLVNALQGKQQATARSAHTDNLYATIFPYELGRDRNSPYLRNSPSDTPWDDMPLLSEILRRYLKV